jgi:replicative DNA helicase
LRTQTIQTPNDVEAERELLVAAFKGGGPTLPPRAVVEKLLVNINSEYMAHPHYSKIFVAIQEAALDAGGTEIDWGDVRGRIPQESVAREVLKSMVTDPNIPPVTERFLQQRIEKLDNAYRSRELKNLSREVTGLAEGGYSEQAYNLLSDGLISLAEDRTSGGARYISEYIPDILQEIDDRRNAPGGIVGLRTGMRPIDLVWKGLEKRKLYFIGARPGNGKSVAIGEVMYNVLNNYPDKRILLASTEMDAGQYITRLAASIAGLDYDKYYGGDYDEDAAEKMKVFVRALKDKRLIVNDGGGQDTHSLRQDIIVTKPDLLLVDYLQEFYPSKPKYQEYADVTMFARELNALKKQFPIAILTALQLSRKVEERDNKRPIASDLRATGWLEQVADGIFMLYNEKKYADSQDVYGSKTVYYDKDGNELDDQLVEWICVKNRQGAPKDIPMYWKDGSMLMENERVL